MLISALVRWVQQRSEEAVFAAAPRHSYTSSTQMHRQLENIVTKLLLLAILLKMARTPPAMNARPKARLRRLSEIQSGHFVDQAS